MFDVGCIYKRDDLHDFLGGRGNRQSGIIYNPEQPDCVIITSGGHGEAYGYADERQPDGSWIYTGQGGKGDQDPDSASNRLLTNRKASVLLFTKATKNQYCYEGEFVVGGMELHTQTSGQRIGDKLIRYKIFPVNQGLGAYEAPEEPDAKPLDLDALREAAKKGVLRTYKTTAEIRKGSDAIKKYARARAKGNCELCVQPAPFKDKQGQPFLEVHHIHRRADDGPDSPENVAALCPNCHRAAHYGTAAQAIKEKLIVEIKTKEEGLNPVTIIRL